MHICKFLIVSLSFTMKLNIDDKKIKFSYEYFFLNLEILK